MHLSISRLISVRAKAFAAGVPRRALGAFPNSGGDTDRPLRNLRLTILLEAKPFCVKPKAVSA